MNLGALCESISGQQTATHAVCGGSHAGTTPNDIGHTAQAFVDSCRRQAERCIQVFNIRKSRSPGTPSATTPREAARLPAPER